MVADHLLVDLGVDRLLDRSMPLSPSRPTGRDSRKFEPPTAFDQRLSRLTQAEGLFDGHYFGSLEHRRKSRGALTGIFLDLMALSGQPWHDLGRSDRQTIADMCGKVSLLLRTDFTPSWRAGFEPLNQVLDLGTQAANSLAKDAPLQAGEYRSKLISNTPVSDVPRWFDPLTPLPPDVALTVALNFFRAAQAILVENGGRADQRVRTELHRVVDYLLRGAGAAPSFRRVAGRLHDELRERADRTDPAEMESLLLNGAMIAWADGKLTVALDRLSARGDALTALGAAAVRYGNEQLMRRLATGVFDDVTFDVTDGAVLGGLRSPRTHLDIDSVSLSRHQPESTTWGRLFPSWPNPRYPEPVTRGRGITTGNEGAHSAGADSLDQLVTPARPPEVDPPSASQTWASEFESLVRTIRGHITRARAVAGDNASEASYEDVAAIIERLGQSRSRQAVHDLCTNSDNPTLRSLEEVAEALGLSLSQLITGQVGEAKLGSPSSTKVRLPLLQQYLSEAFTARQADQPKFSRRRLAAEAAKKGLPITRGAVNPLLTKPDDRGNPELKTLFVLCRTLGLGLPELIATATN